MYIAKIGRAHHSVLERFDPDPHRGKGEVKFRVQVHMRCEHCDYQVPIPDDGYVADVGDLCRHCWRFICAECVKKGSCNPQEKRLAEWESGKVAFNPYRT